MCVPAERAFEFLVFQLGGEEYGVDIQTVQELRAYTAVTGLANAPAFMMGVVNLRGQIVPILDLRVKFKLARPSYNPSTVVIILYLAGSQVGVVVDSVSGVVTLDAGQLKPAPQLGAVADAGYLLGVGALERRMIQLVDMDRLLAADLAAPRREARP